MVKVKLHTVYDPPTERFLVTVGYDDKVTTLRLTEADFKKFISLFRERNLKRKVSFTEGQQASSGVQGETFVLRAESAEAKVAIESSLAMKAKALEYLERVEESFETWKATNQN